MTSAITLQRANPDADRQLRDLLESYVAELSAIFDVKRGSDGRFGYEKLALYWTEPESRYAFLIKVGAEVAGFILVTRGSPATDSTADLDIAEFFVLPAHRRAGVGRQAAVALWNQMPGQWVVRVSEANDGALQFWTGVISSYTAGAFAVRRLPKPPLAWRIFVFASAAKGSQEITGQ